MNLLDLFLSLGYSYQEYNTIRSKIELSDSVLYNYVKNNYEWFLGIYNKKSIIKMTVSYPLLYTLGVSNMQEKINALIKLGYTKSEVIKITKVNPSLYGYSVDTINDKMQYMINLGYSREDVIKMTKIQPAIWGYDKESISNKLNFIVCLFGLHSSYKFPSIFK